MSEPDKAEPGLLLALRRMSATLLELGRVRLALLGNELEQEKLRLFGAALSAALALVLLCAGLVSFSVLIVLMMGAEYRLWSLGVLTVTYLGLAFVLWRRATRGLSRPGGPFAASLGELVRDRDTLRAPE